MKYAEKITDITNAFKHGPLTGEELEEFYHPGTMECRMGDPYASPIENIFEACQIPSSVENAFLLMGHKGCGKSTELARMSARLKEIGYQVRNIGCATDLDLRNLVYTDLLILMGDALMSIADATGCPIEDALGEQIQVFWKEEIDACVTCTDESTLWMEAGGQAKTPGILAPVLHFFATVKGDLKYNEEKRTTYKTKISQRSSEWLRLLGRLSIAITSHLEGRQPILIFEDLDKLNPEEAWTIFSKYAATLTGVPIPVIYTFPIALSYDYRFAALEGYFRVETLPMIKQGTADGAPYEAGSEVIRALIGKRADLKLFEEDVLTRLITKTGGSLRDLFYAINACAQRAIRRDAAAISMEDAERALTELQTSLTRRIERKHYGFLAAIYRGNHQTIEDKAMLLEMVLANVVLEYNTKRWHNVHPLVVDFLVDQGLMEDES